MLRKRERPLILEHGAHLLDDAVRASYEPSKTELRDYAAWLGMKPGEDDQYLSIAEEGLKSGLPDGWKTCESAEGEVFYFNTLTGESTWDHPIDTICKAKLAAAKNPQKSPVTESEIITDLRQQLKHKDDEIYHLNEALAGLVETLRASQAEVLHLSSRNSADDSAMLRQELLDIKKFLADAIGNRSALKELY